MAVPKEPDKTHPYRQKEVIQLVNQDLETQPKINSYDILCINTIYRIKSKPEFCYNGKFGPHQYSPQFIDCILKQATRNPNLLSVTREKYKKGLRRPSRVMK